MVSNALSARRGPLRRPKVCLTHPNPGRCEPPPPPIDWPPTTIDFDFEYTYWWFFLFKTVSWLLGLVRIPPAVWWWQGSGTGPVRSADFIVDDTAHTVTILVSGTNPDFGGYTVERNDFPLIWGVSTSYVVSSWDSMTSPLTEAEATFIF